MSEQAARACARNLATEVVKGMTQKVKAGGTATRAPVGYVNVRAVDRDGREARTVAVDEERASHIRWAFEAYATGERTINALAEELAARALTTRPTPKRPSRPVASNSLQKMLRPPYYVGFVVWNGAMYPGRHEPLVAPDVGQRVQDVLDQKRVGEKTRRHPHYLKSTVVCRGCNRSGPSWTRWWPSTRLRQVPSLATRLKGQPSRMLLTPYCIAEHDVQKSLRTVYGTQV